MRGQELHPAGPFRHETSRGVYRFLRDDAGQAATEYVLIVGLVCLVIIFAFNRIQDSLKALLARVVAGLNGPGI